MGFVNEQNKREYWRVGGGMLTKKCKAGDVGAKPYTPAQGKHAGQTMHRLEQRGYDGYITSVSFYDPKDSDFEEELCIEFDNKVLITCTAKGSYLLRFAGICRKIDVGEKVIVTPFSMPKESDPSKNFVGWSWSQHGQKLVPDSPMLPNSEDSVVPKPVEAMVGKKRVLDWTDREVFLKDVILDWAFQNKLTNVQPTDPMRKVVVPANDAPFDGGEEML